MFFGLFINTDNSLFMVECLCAVYRFGCAFKMSLALNKVWQIRTSEYPCSTLTATGRSVPSEAAAKPYIIGGLRVKASECGNLAILSVLVIHLALPKSCRHNAIPGVLAAFFHLWWKEYNGWRKGRSQLELLEMLHAQYNKSLSCCFCCSFFPPKEMLSTPRMTNKLYNISAWI